MYAITSTLLPYYFILMRSGYRYCYRQEYYLYIVHYVIIQVVIIFYAVILYYVYILI